MPHSRPTDPIVLLAALAAAALRLADEHQHIVDLLTASGLIDDYTRAVLTARLDQLAAATSALGPALPKLKRAADQRDAGTIVPAPVSRPEPR